MCLLSQTSYIDKRSLYMGLPPVTPGSGGTPTPPPATPPPPPPPQQGTGETLSASDRESVIQAVNELSVDLADPGDLSILEWIGQLNEDEKDLLDEILAAALEGNKALLLSISDLGIGSLETVIEAFEFFSLNEAKIGQLNDIRNELNEIIEGANLDLTPEEIAAQEAGDLLLIQAYEAQILLFNQAQDDLNAAKAQLEAAFNSGNEAAWDAARAQYNSARAAFIIASTNLENAADAYNTRALDFVDQNTTNQFNNLVTRFNNLIASFIIPPESTKFDPANFGIAPLTFFTSPPIPLDPISSPPTVPPNIPGSFNLVDSNIVPPGPPATQIRLTTDILQEIPPFSLGVLFGVDFIGTIESQQLSNEIAQLIEDGTLTEIIELLLLFIKRGSTTSEIYEPEAVGVGGNVTSQQAASLSAKVLGLASPRLQGVLGSLLEAEEVNNLYEQLINDGEPGLVQSFANLVTVSAGLGVLSSLKAADKATELLATKITPDTFPEALATTLGVTSTLIEFLDGATLRDDLANLFGANSGLSSLPAGQQEAFLESVGNVANFSILFAAGSDLANAIDSPTLQIGSIVDLVLGQGELPGEAPTGNSLQATQEAFADVLQAGGIAGDASKALAIQLASGLFVAEDPDAFLREALGSYNVPEAVEQIKTAAVLAPLAEQVGVGGGFLKAAVTGEGESALLNAGLDPEALGKVQDIAGQNLSFAAKVALLNSAVGKEATTTSLKALGQLDTLQNLKASLEDDLGSNDASVLANLSLNVYNSIENRLQAVVDEFYKDGPNARAEKADDLRLDDYLNRYSTQNYDNFGKLYLAAVGSLWGEGVLSGGLNMRTDTGSNTIAISA